MSRGNVKDLSVNLTLIARKLKKQNKLIRSATSLPLGWSVMQESEQDPMASDFDNAQKMRQAE